MTQIRIVLNGDVVMDQDIGEWTDTAPDFFKDRVRPGVKPEPWMQAIMVVMVDAIQRDRATTIGVRTSIGEWVMKVKMHK